MSYPFNLDLNTETVAGHDLKIRYEPLKIMRFSRHEKLDETSFRG